MKPDTKNKREALQIKGLSKTYSNGVRAIKKIDLQVQEGDFFALLGPNGAGKSTLIGILTGLVIKTSGTVKICGFDLDESPAAAKASLGVVPQEFNFNIFESVLNTVTYQAGYYGIPRKIALQRAEKYLKQLGLWDKRHQPGRNLSGGMKRRLMLARALVNEPRILILDEPTAGLDIELRYSLWTFLRNLNQQGTTIILTTHYLEEAEQLCRRVGIIHMGELLLEGSIDEVLRKLERQNFILDLSHPAPSKLPTIKGGTLKRLDDTHVELEVHAETTLTEIFQELAFYNIQVISLRNKTNRLEELFLNLVSETS